MTATLDCRPTRLRMTWVGQPIVLGRSPSTKPPSAVTESFWADQIYRIAHEWLYSRFVTHMAVVSDNAAGEAVSLELCHTWRIERGADHRLHGERWNPLLNGWEPVDWSDVPRLPLFTREVSGKCAQWLIEEACRWYVDCAATLLKSYTTPLKLDRQQVARRLSVDRCRHKAKFEPLTQASSVARTALWRLLDRGIVSMVARVHLRPTLADYARIADHLEAVRRVHAEHPNLLPLLRHILPASWGDTNLFAHYRWQGVHAPLKASFASRRAWRTFLSTPAPVHASWVSRLYQSGARLPFAILYEVLSHVQRPAQTLWVMRVVRALAHGVHHFQRADTRTLSERDHQMLARLVDCFFDQARALRAAHGWKRATGQLGSQQLGDLLDWWFGEGRARGLPDRQSTWASLSRAARQWEIDVSRRRAGWDEVWYSALPATRIDGVDVIPLDTGEKLLDEGTDMHHCVGSYISICLSDAQRIFSLRANGHRSTLRIQRRGNHWTVAEHRAACNSQPAAELACVGHRVAAAYEVAEQAAEPCEAI